MKKQSIILLFFSLTFLFVSCQYYKPDNNKSKIRGKIVNPRSDEVIIYRDFLGLDADTLFFHKDNEVKAELDSIQEGLYFLNIYPEFQSIYLKPGDSLAFHININEFDESLSFSGQLGMQNNLLIDLFLLNEKQSEYFYDHHFDFSLNDFEKKIDSFEQVTNRLIDTYKEDLQHTTPKFKAILELYKKSIQYNLKEAYLQKHPEINFPDSYTAYRKIWQSEIADPNTIYMYAFADTYLKGLAQKTTSLNYKKLAFLINENISDSVFKTNLLLKYCLRYIKEKRPAGKDSTMQAYFQFMNHPEYKAYCSDLLHKNKRLQAGKTIPDIQLKDPYGQKVSLHQFLNKPATIISFWDTKRRRNFISNLEKLKSIKESFPDLQILIINTGYNDFNAWKMQIPVKSDFVYMQTPNHQEVEKIKPYHLAQVYLLKADTIKGSMCNMYQTKFKEILAKKLSLKQ